MKCPGCSVAITKKSGGHHLIDVVAAKLAASKQLWPLMETSLPPAEVIGDIKHEIMESQHLAAQSNKNKWLGKGCTLVLKKTYGRSERPTVPPSHTVSYAMMCT